MQRRDVPSIFDPTNRSASIAATPSRAVNWMLQSTAPGHARAPVQRVRTPGLRHFSDFPGGGPIRGLFEINDRGFVAGGPQYAEFFPDGTFGTLHNIANDGLPVSFASNGSTGHQNMLTSAGLGYIHGLQDDSFGQIIDENFPSLARKCEYIDGYFLVLQGGGSRAFFWSKLFDGLTWPGLNFLELSEAADNVTSMIRVGRYVWFIGFRTSEVFSDIGNPTETFAPVPGVFSEYGGQGIFSPQRLGDTILWLQQNEQGQGTIVQANGYTAEKVSTFAIDTTLQRLLTPTDASAFCYQLNGHECYVIVLPRGETNLVYDKSMNAWHEWGTWDKARGVWTPNRAGCHTYVFNQHFVGDRLSGAIYQLSQDVYNDEILPVA